MQKKEVHLEWKIQTQVRQLKIDKFHTLLPKLWYIAEGIYELLENNWHGNASKCVWYSINSGVKSVVIKEKLNFISIMEIRIYFPDKYKIEEELLAFLKNAITQQSVAVWVYCPNIYFEHVKGIVFFGNFFVKDVLILKNIWSVILKNEKTNVENKHKILFNTNVPKKYIKLI